MKNLDLATLGVEELNEVQMQEVDGGWFKEVVLALHGVFFEWGRNAGREDREKDK